MPNNVVFKVANAIHGGLTAITFGKVGWSLQGMPVIELTTTGRKSGQPRTNRLADYQTKTERRIPVVMLEPRP